VQWSCGDCISDEEGALGNGQCVAFLFLYTIMHILICFFSVLLLVFFNQYRCFKVEFSLSGSNPCADALESLKKSSEIVCPNDGFKQQVTITFLRFSVML
jgi:hypothetical protein